MDYKRRNFMKVMGVGTVSLGVPIAILKSIEDDISIEQPEKYITRHDDIRLRVISYGLLAPNPHNKQPWKIKLIGKHTFELFVDHTRLLKETDPFFRQIHIGQGTFLENIKISASYFGYKPNIKYFPQGQYSNDKIQELPIAEITLEKTFEKINVDLFHYITKRQSNKSVFEKVAIKQNVLEQFKNSITENGIGFGSTNDTNDLESLSLLMEKAMTTEVGDYKRDMETVKMFRFNDDEAKLYLDGFGVSQSGKTGITKFIVERFFLDRKATEKDPTSFGEQAVSLTKDQAHSASAYCWILSDSNERIDQVKCGEAYNRMNLIATQLGLAMHPMSQVLQEYKDMNELQQEFLKYLKIPNGKTVQMLFRLGRAKPVTHSLRRSVKDILV